MKNRGIIVISSLVVIGGGIAYLLWKRKKNKEEQKTKDDANAPPKEDGSTPKGDTPKADTPPKEETPPKIVAKTALDGTPLEQVLKNLGTGAIQTYTDRVVATVKVSGKLYQGMFYTNGRYFLFNNGKVVKNGKWSDGGKTITLSNNKIISSGSVWNNIKSSV
jgi:hypothetical protein